MTQFEHNLIAMFILFILIQLYNRLWLYKQPQMKEDLQTYFDWFFK